MDNRIKSFQPGPINRSGSRRPGNLTVFHTRPVLSDQTRDAVAARCQERDERRTNQTACTGDEYLHRSSSLVQLIVLSITGMSKHVLARHLMPISKEPRQFPPGPYATKQPTQTSARQRVCYPILQNTAGSSVRFNPVGMLPVGKRAGDLDIPELDSGFVVAVFGDPLSGEGTKPHTQHHSSTVLNATAAFNNFHRLPGRRKTLERPRLRVPRKDLSRRRRNTHPADKNLGSHDILPNATEPVFFSP